MAKSTTRIDDIGRHTARAALLTAALALSSCGGGGGGGGGGSDSGAVPQSSTARSYRVEATVSGDTCGERLANVNQIFTIEGGVLDTSLVKIALSEVEGTLQGGFVETNGSCTRSYDVTLSDAGDIQASTVTLRSRTECPTVSCGTEWIGAVTPVAVPAAEVRIERVRGEACNPNVPTEVGYRPSLFECNGNAAVLMSGRHRNNYSVVVRRDGQFNDRDPLNPSCGTNRCSPYKTQKRIELPEYQVNCLGDSGFSDYYAPVNRISIKFTAQVTNANDTSQFEQYCLNNTRESFN